jgi:hypothetical protein
MNYHTSCYFDTCNKVVRFAYDHSQILDTNPALHFALLRLQLIELVRNCTSSSEPDVMGAITFAQTQLAPRAATTPEFLKDLELTMSLLVLLPSESPLLPQFAELLNPSLRRDVASRVNEAILVSIGARSEARLRSLVRLRMWAEQKARAMGKDLPPVIPFGLQDSDEDMNDSNGNRDPGDVMVS